MDLFTVQLGYQLYNYYKRFCRGFLFHRLTYDSTNGFVFNKPDALNGVMQKKYDLFDVRRTRKLMLLMCGVEEEFCKFLGLHN